MDKVESRRLVLLIILLSLLWNGICIIILLCIQDDVHRKNPLSVTFEQETTKDESKQQESLPEKKDDNSTFFVTQLVSNGTSPCATTILPQPLSGIPSIQTNLATLNPQQPLEQNNDPQQEDLKEKLEKAPVQNLGPYKENIEEDTPEDQNIAQTETNDVPSKSEQNSDLNEEKLLTSGKELGTIFADRADTAPSRKKISPTSHASNKASSCSKPRKKKTLGLADIAQGYMEHVAKDRENTIEQQFQSLPTNKQMALHVYATKIFSLLEQAAKVNQKLLYAPKNRTTDATLMLTINNDGQLLEVHLVPTLHEKEIRDWLFNFINHVGLFPPIPKHLKQEKLTLSFPMRIDIHEGFGTYSLYYGLASRY